VPGRALIAAEQTADEQARRHHLDARSGRDGALAPCAKADCPAHRLTNQACHAAGCGTGSQPAWFEHKDAPSIHRCCIEQRERHQGCLARARRSDEHGVGLCAKNRKQARKALCYWQIGHTEINQRPDPVS